MSRRSPMNERYRDNSETAESKGKTRKSAASAKPVSKAGASVRTKAAMDPKEKRKLEREEQRKKEARAAEEPVVYNEKEAFWRKIWWVCFALALVCLALSWFAGRIVPAEFAQTVTIGAMIFAYVFLAGMIFVDIKFVRPARIRAREKGLKGLSKKEQRERERQLAAEAERRAANPTPIDRVRAYLNGSSKDKKKDAETK